MDWMGLQVHKAKEWAKSYLKRLIAKKIIQFVVKKILFMLAPYLLPIIGILLMFLFLWSVFFQLPEDFSKNQGGLGFFSTFDSEWNIQKDNQLMTRIQSLSNTGALKEGDGGLNYESSEQSFGSTTPIPYSIAGSEFNQASQYKLKWSVLAGVIRMIGDPVLADKNHQHRLPDPVGTYKWLGPFFYWKPTTVTVTVCGKDHCYTSTYKYNVIRYVNQYDQGVHITYRWETIHPSKNVTVTHEVVASQSVEKWPQTRLQGFLAHEGLNPKDDEFALQLADRYDQIASAGGLAGTVGVGDVLTGTGNGLVPAQYIPIYKAAALKYGIPWTVLAAIHWRETTFGTDLSTSSTGAQGQMQFEPGTWAEFGVDANGDGKKDPYNVEDAVYSAANYLSNTMRTRHTDLRAAIYQYNNADWYVNEVMNKATAFGMAEQNGTLLGGPGNVQFPNIPATGVAKNIVNFALTFQGKVRYSLGGGRNASDIQNNIFDCSSFVQHVFAQYGYHLGTTTYEQINNGRPVALNQLKPGDLVFFDTGGAKPSHVGIYIGNGNFVGAQDHGCYAAGVKWFAQVTGNPNYILARRILPG